MNPKKAMLISLGISMALIALGILFLYTNHMSEWYGSRGWHLENGPMRGGALVLVKILFWSVLLAGLILVLLGFMARTAHLPKSALDNDTLNIAGRIRRSCETGQEAPNNESNSISNPQLDCELETTVK